MNADPTDATPLSAAEGPALAPPEDESMPGGRMRAALGLSILLALWFWAHPYYGIRHDSLLYLGQALDLIRPDIFDRDLFFRFGSQARFTIWGPLMAGLVERFDAGSLELVLTAVCNAAYVVALWLLCGRLAGSLRWFGVLAAVVLPTAYGRLMEFHVGENFFTARSIAEPLVLAGLAAWVGRRRMWGSAGLVLAGAFHPLVALPGLVAAWCFEVQLDRRWLWALATLVPVGVAASMGVSPFDRLFERMDPAWWRLVVDSTSQVDVTRWTMQDDLSALFDLTVLGVMSFVLHGRTRVFARGLLAANALLLPLTLLGASVAHDVLIAQAQLWRVLWLDHVVAMMGVGVLAAGTWGRGPVWRWLGAAGIAAAIAVGWTVPYAWAAVAWWGVAAVAVQDPAVASHPACRFAQWATWLLVAGLTALLTLTVWNTIAADPVQRGAVWPAQSLFFVPACSALFAFGLRWLATRGHPAVGAALVLAVLAAGGSRWDERSVWHLAVESATPSTQPFAGRIPDHAQVYWHTELLPTWLMLRRASWVSTNQGAGVVFNRETAFEYDRRIAPVVSILREQFACQQAVAARGQAAECEPSQRSVEALCRTPEGPDFVVFDNVRYDRGLVAAWPYKIGPLTPWRTAYLYACTALR